MTNPSDTTPAGLGELREQIADIIAEIVGNYNSGGNIPDIAASCPVELDAIMLHITAAVQAERTRLFDDLVKWTEYNEHDMGELGMFIRTQYIQNWIEEQRQALARLQSPQGTEGAN